VLTHWSMHGLVVASELPLPDCRAACTDRADIKYRVGPVRVVPGHADPSRVLARMPHSAGDGAFFTLTEKPVGGWVLRFHGVCDVIIAADLSSATFHMDSSANAEVASVLASGLVISVLLMLRGHLVLHASAVEHGSSTVAVVGRSGMGKSTLSALLCRAGARLVADDVLRVDLADGEALCRLGSTEARLRAQATGLLSEDDVVRQTVDGRSAVSLPLADKDSVPLRCIVVPFPDRSATRVEVTRTSQVEALMLLASFPRVVGWEDARTRGEQFALTSELVSRIPVVKATVPWGPPFPDDLGAGLLAALPV
jgi:hypothetical protein